MKKLSEKTRGITLIALVITIIVLLILAGVSIAMLTGDNGILTQANKSKTENEKATALEKVKMEVAGSLNTNGKLDLEVLNDNLKKNIEGLKYNNKEISEDDSNRITNLPAVVELNSYIIKISNNGRVTLPVIIETLEDIKGKYYPEDTDIITGEQTITIPGGATISGITDECKTIDDGLVIYMTNEDIIKDWTDTETIQKTYDQFVWIPVDKEMAIIEEGKEIIGNSNTEKYASLKTFIETNSKTAGKYPMAVKKTDGTYSGILYDFLEKENVVEVKPRDYTTTLSYREPDIVLNDERNNITKNSLQEEYKNMIEKVENNGGFWVGRYETTNMNSEDFLVKTVTVIKGTTEGISNVNWYKMYEGQKSYESTKLAKSINTTSSMIWGSQWDQIMIWMKNVQNTINGKYYVINSVGMGNFGDINGVNDGYPNTSLPANTGCFEVKNIYDLAGNVTERDFEEQLNSDRGVRGGTYRSIDFSSSSRSATSPESISLVYGSRITLY